MITFNPTLQTTALGSFTLESDGVITGTAYPDPSARFRLAGGYLSPDELLPMWGGVAISENTPAYSPKLAGPPAYPPPGTPRDIGPPRPELGGRISRATDDTDITGFSVFDQNHAMLNFPGSPVPQTAPGGMVTSTASARSARLALPMNPASSTRTRSLTAVAGSSGITTSSGSTPAGGVCRCASSAPSPATAWLPCMTAARQRPRQRRGF